MRLFFIIVSIVAIAALGFLLTRSGPEPIAYAPAPSSPLPPVDMGPLTPETTTQASLPETGSHQWHFEAAAGDTITVQLIATSGSLSILPPGDMFALVQARVDDAKDTAEICAQALTVAGTYTLLVEGVSAPGLYTIRIERLGPPTDQPLSAVTETISTGSSTMTVVRSAPCQLG